MYPNVLLFFSPRLDWVCGTTIRIFMYHNFKFNNNGKIIWDIATFSIGWASQIQETSCYVSTCTNHQYILYFLNNHVTVINSKVSLIFTFSKYDIIQYKKIHKLTLFKILSEWLYVGFILHLFISLNKSSLK